MSDAERAEYRAQGAFENFIETMKKEMSSRSPEYAEKFWLTLDSELFGYMRNKRLTD